MLCQSCGTENPEGKKFCGKCGSPLALSCPACGSPNPPDMKFCGDCGATLGAAPQAAPSPAAPREASTAERRLVSVLVAGLVGVTPLSESRDAEEVRELLSRYFEQARTVIERHGGTVEKFIGDAVMAVWGAPVAKEDDAQRAVRAALDLVGVVTALGHEVGAPGLRARAGVLTGEAAVMPEGTGEGLVAGGLVKTASRIQSVAEPGTVLVGESTKRASEAAIAYEDARTRELKGKAEPVAVFRALAKLHAAVDEHIPDPEERLWVVPRLAHLLGVEEGVPGDQENLFSAWRILFERLAELSPTILVFEDMQWADAGLLDFLEYLLEWSRSHPLFVLVLARPELADKRPTWGAGKRSFTSLHLEPLAPQVMSELLTGLVPGLPEELREDILERAEGIPLYAVETVRMLLDRGLLEQAGNVYRPTGPIETLDVPETLHALIAARLDGLTPEERRLVQDGAVLGKTFTRLGLGAVTGMPDEEL